MKAYTYLLVDFACIIVPFLFSFHPKIKFNKNWKYFFPANISVALFFLIWDYYFTKIEVWGFNQDYLSGLYILNLPIEEVLFFICIPYACVFTYHVIEKYFGHKFIQNKKKWAYLLFASLFLLFAIYNIDKYYTFSTFFLLSIFISLAFFHKEVNATTIIISYSLILPFFIISNGVLTGSWIESPIVWYNDDHNLGFRILTIPIEDTFYGFLLIFMNIFGYEKIKNYSS